MDIEKDDIPNPKGASRSFLFSGGLNHVDRSVKCFGLFTMLTTLIVIGMSIYVVHYKEFRTSGQILVDDGGKPLATATAETIVNLDHASLTDTVLAHLKRVNIKTADGGTVGWNVVAYEKRAEDGIIVLHGPESRVLTITDGTAKSAAIAQRDYGIDLNDVNGGANSTAMTGSTGGGRRRRQLTIKGHRGRLLSGVSASGAMAPGASTSDSTGAAPIEWDVPMPVIPGEETVKGWNDGCLDAETYFMGTSNNPSSKPCNCLKKEYWSDPSKSQCGMRPTSSELTPAYLDKWAYNGDDCSSKPCFNFDANTAVPYANEYRGNAKFRADFPTTAYTGRMSSGGYMGGAPGMSEALSCRGRVTKEAPWWKPWKSDTIEYKCVLRYTDDYARRKSTCSCPWYKFLGCTGNDERCGKHGQCFLTTMDMNKYCQPKYGQTLEAYGLSR